MTMMIQKKKAAVLLLAGLILFEVLLRLFPFARLEITPQHFYKPDERLGWEMTENASYVFYTQEYRHPVRINSAGFRDAERSLKKKGEIYRVVGSGGSFSFGYGVSYEDSYLRLLEKKWNAAGTFGQELEVIKMGVPGYAFLQNAQLIEEKAFAYDPDLILLEFNSNDHIESLESAYRIVHGFLVRDPDSQGPFLKERLYVAKYLKTFHLLWKSGSLIYDRITESEEERKYKDPAQRARRKDQALSRVETRLAELKRLCDERNIRLMIFYIPHRSQVYPEKYSASFGYYFEDLARRLAEMAGAYGIEFLDLLPDMRRAAKEGRQLYYRIDGHWNPSGHRFASEILFRHGAGLKSLDPKGVND